MIKFLTHIDASLSRILRLPVYDSLGDLPAAISDNEASLAYVDGEGVYYQSGLSWIKLSDIFELQYKGLASPATLPADDTGFWLSAEPGTYTNFPDSGGVPIEVTGYFSIIYHNGTGWAFDSFNLAPQINDTPLAYVPATTGNTQNLNEIVKASDGTMWFIDLAGRGHRFTITDGDIEITDAQKGVIFRTSGGARLRTRVLSHGALQTTEL